MTKFICKALIVSLIAAFIQPAFAQTHAIVGLFPTYNQNGHITKKWDYSIYSFLAIYPFEQTRQTTVYPAKVNALYAEFDATYNFNSKWSATASYTFERVNPFRTDWRNENRAWLQLKWVKPIKKFKMHNRLRYDFRFIHNRLTDNWDYSPRIRYLLGFEFPFKKGPYIAIYNEFFLDTYSTPINNLSENWAYAAYGFNIAKRTKLELGVLMLSWIRSAQNDWLDQWFLQATLITQLDIYKKKKKTE